MGRAHKARKDRRAIFPFHFTTAEPFVMHCLLLSIYLIQKRIGKRERRKNQDEW